MHLVPLGSAGTTCCLTQKFAEPREEAINHRDPIKPNDSGHLPNEEALIGYEDSILVGMTLGVLAKTLEEGNNKAFIIGSLNIYMEEGHDPVFQSDASG